MDFSSTGSFAWLYWAAIADLWAFNSEICLPMYAGFPFAAVLLKKGVKFSNIIIFLNAWCVTKFSTLLFEIGALGYKFTLYRLIINIPGIIVMGYIIDLLVNKKPHKI